jgi:4-alpha-glucanotransferase
MAAVSLEHLGIDDGYFDALGKRHETSDETKQALRKAMSLPEEALTSAAMAPPVRLWKPGSPPEDRRLPGGGDLELEDGRRVSIDGELPAELPFGYHRLFPSEGGETLLIATPGHCFLPEDLKIWGFAAQVYAARSRDSWGIGDLSDLTRLGRWTRQLGGDLIMVNPLSAATPVAPIEPSPYFPSSRRFDNPLYLRIEAVPGWQELDAGTRERLAAAGRALNAERRIDRDAVFRLKMEALDAIFAQTGGGAVVDAELVGRGQALVDFATYCTLAETHGKDWRQWPEEHRRPDAAGVVRFREANLGRVRFHVWLQALLTAQREAANAAIPLMNDMPIGIDVAGADAWCWQDLLAKDVSVGAPADEFNVAGQDWGLTPLVPYKLRAAGYGPFIETIRAMLRNVGALRIDHVMGLFRLYWIPRALGTRNGGYVRFRADELLAIVALESQRKRAVVVGEDLGTVEAGVREKLAEHRMLSYRLAYFEPGPPSTFPELALASVTTHDLPTVAGLWTGSDLDALVRIGIQPNKEGTAELRRKLRDHGALPDDAPAEAAVEATYRTLGQAPSRILLATLDDALAVTERPNMPGTVAQWPNWSLALPKTLEEIETLEAPRRIAQALSRKGR